MMMIDEWYPKWATMMTAKVERRNGDNADDSTSVSTSWTSVTIDRRRATAMMTRTVVSDKDVHRPWASEKTMRTVHSESGETKDVDGEMGDDDDDNDGNDLTRMIRNVLEIIDWLNQSQQTPGENH